MSRAVARRSFATWVSISPSSGPPLPRRRASSRRRSYSAAIRAGSRTDRLDLAPDPLVEPVGAHLRVRAHPLAAEAVGVAAAAAVVGVGARLALRGPRA